MRVNKIHYFHLTLLFVLLASLFVYAIYYQILFFVYLIVILLMTVLFLLRLNVQLIKGQAEIDIRRQDTHENINLLEVDFVRERKAIHSLHEKIINYGQLKDFTEKLCKSFTVDDTAKTLTLEANKLFSHKEVTIILYFFYPKSQSLGIVSSRRMQRDFPLKAKRGDRYDQWVIQTMKPLLIEDIKRDFRFDEERMQGVAARPIRSMMSVPLALGNRVIGLLRADSPQENHFTMEDVRLLSSVGNLGTVAIENAQLYERIEDLATRDSLTGLYIRRFLWERLPQEISRKLRTGGKISFLMFDLDNFKQYNDTFGHTAGDILLRTVATILHDTFAAPGQMVCRYGGEEFAVLLPDCSKEDAVKMAEMVRKKIFMQSIILRREKTQISVSIGIASFPEDAQLKEELVLKADQALYRAKAEGKNKVCVA